MSDHDSTHTVSWFSGNAKKKIATQHMVYDKFNSGVPDQNGIWVKFSYFWPKNDKVDMKYHDCTNIF